MALIPTPSVVFVPPNNALHRCCGYAGSTPTSKSAKDIRKKKQGRRTASPLVHTGTHRPRLVV